MARREVTADEEARLVAEAEAQRGSDEAWDFEQARKVRRGAEPTAVVSVRVSFEEMQRLRRLAERKKISLSDLLKDALDAYVEAGGPSFSSSRVQLLHIFTQQTMTSETRGGGGVAESHHKEAVTA